jgi:hypothetical protein
MIADYTIILGWLFSQANSRIILLTSPQLNLFLGFVTKNYGIYLPFQVRRTKVLVHALTSVNRKHLICIGGRAGAAVSLRWLRFLRSAWDELHQDAQIFGCRHALKTRRHRFIAQEVDLLRTAHCRPRSFFGFHSSAFRTISPPWALQQFKPGALPAAPLLVFGVRWVYLISLYAVTHLKVQQTNLVPAKFAVDSPVIAVITYHHF